MSLESKTHTFTTTRRTAFVSSSYKIVHTQSIKLTLQQSIITLANFFSEQLEGDLKRTKLIDEGQLTPREAEQQAEEWERVRTTTKLYAITECGLCVSRCFVYVLRETLHCLVLSCPVLMSWHDVCPRAMMDG